MRVAIHEAIQPVRQAAEKRLLDERLINRAISELPFWGRTEQDEARLRRECAEILAELPLGATEVEGKEALEPTVQEARAEIEKRQLEKDRQARKASLIQQGIAEVSSYLLDLKSEGKICDEDYWDSEFTANLREAVQRRLDADLTGDESTKKVREFAQKIIDSEIG